MDDHDEDDAAGYDVIDVHDDDVDIDADVVADDDDDDRLHARSDGCINTFWTMSSH